MRKMLTVSTVFLLLLLKDNLTFEALVASYITITTKAMSGKMNFYKTRANSGSMTKNVSLHHYTTHTHTSTGVIVNIYFPHVPF